MLDIPVVGLSEATFHSAYTLGQRIVIICLTSRHRAWYGESAEAAGLRDRIVNFKGLTCRRAEYFNRGRGFGGSALRIMQTGRIGRPSGSRYPRRRSDHETDSEDIEPSTRAIA